MFTDAVLNLKIGGSFRSEWIEAVPEVAEVASALDATRSAVASVGRQSAKVSAMPPERRGIHLDGLAKAGLSQMEALAKREAALQERLAKIENGYDEVTRSYLRTPKASVHDGLAAMQIRERIAKSDNPAMKAREYLTDREVMSAILSVIPAASGLTREQFGHLLAAAEQHHLPNIAEGRRVLANVRTEIERSFNNAREMIGEATGLQKTAAGWVAPWQMEEVA